MAALTVPAVGKLLSLRAELEETLKCNFCDNILQKARTLNCPHHVCESCAVKQQTDHGTCRHCMCSYYRKDITSNVVVNNIVETFHDLASNIERAAQLEEMETDGKYKAQISEEEYSEDEGENQENGGNHNNRKRKRSRSLDGDSENGLNGHCPSAKKRKLSHPLDDRYDSNALNAVTPPFPEDAAGEVGGLNPTEKTPEEKEESPFWTPTQICITGYDAATTAKFQEYAEALGIELSSKWTVGSTDILISKSNIQNGKPHITFKVLASILRNIPVVKESFLEDSYESGRILDHQKYICNYRRVENEQLFGGLSILFAV